METDVKLTKLASCAGCGAKVGAGTLVKMLEGFRTHTDPRLIVGYDKSDDASVYVVSDDTAIVQTTDFFPPIVDDPFLYGQIAATNALSDVYAMGGAPKLALNIMCLADSMDDETVREILRGSGSAGFPANLKPRSVTTELEASDRLLTASAVMETLLQSVPTTSFPANSKRLQKMPVMPASFPYCVRTAGFRVSV